MLRKGAIDQAFGHARETAARFPFVLLAGVVAAVAAIAAFDRRGADDLVRLVLTASLGLPLLFAVAVTAERRVKTRAGVVASILCVLLLAAFQLIAGRWPEPQRVTRFVQLVVAFHLLVAVLPFWGAGTLRGFWQYNRMLFLRYLLASLYAVVLFAGLALALVALDQLFGVDIDGDNYTRLFFILAFIFHPWFFLAGVPRDLDALDELEEYPVGLKVFAQFVLVPLVTVYLLILTAYLVRVIATQTWPSGWIGYLVSGVAAVGTLALLLVHPIRERADAQWVNAYGRWFYVVLLPSIGMLLMAIGLRLGQYGFTERRYFLLVLSVWLAGIALYYGVTGSRNIRVIPASLCLLALLTFAGPWSAYAVSRRSQADRLEELLGRNGILTGDRVTPDRGDVSYEDRREISAAVRYLVNTHGPRSLAPLHPSLADTTHAVRDPRGEPVHVDDLAAEAVVERIGVRYVSRYEARELATQSFFIAGDETSAIDVSSFDVLTRSDLVTSPRIPVGSDTVHIAREPGNVFEVRYRGARVGALPVDSLVRTLRPDSPGRPSPREVPTGRRSVELNAPELRVRVIFTRIGGSYDRESGSQELNTAFGDILIDVPDH